MFLNAKANFVWTAPKLVYSHIAPCNAPYCIIALYKIMNNCNHSLRDNNTTEMSPGPQRSKDIIKIVHVTSGFQP